MDFPEEAVESLQLDKIVGVSQVGGHAGQNYYFPIVQMWTLRPKECKFSRVTNVRSAWLLLQQRKKLNSCPVLVRESSLLMIRKEPLNTYRVLSAFCT